MGTSNTEIIRKTYSYQKVQYLKSCANKQDKIKRTELTILKKKGDSH